MTATTTDYGHGVTVTGLTELNAALQALDNTIMGKWTNQSLYRGVKALRGIARNEVPEKTGELSRTIRVGRSRRINEYQRAYFLVAGNRKKGKGYYAEWVEKGTKPHHIEGAKGGLSINGAVRHSVNHPGAQANPFFERTLRQGEDASLRAYVDWLSGILKKEGLISISAEENAPDEPS